MCTCNPEIAAQAIKVARQKILDTVESAIGGTPNWVAVRKKLLSALGYNGLEGTLLGKDQQRYGTNDQSFPCEDTK